jgi:hypothetical protein
MRRQFAAAALLACVAYVGCGEEKKNPASPSPTATVSTTEPINGATTGSTQVPFHLLHPVQFPMDQGIVAFPPRNEPNAFFSDLQVLYRDYLKRSQTAMSYVDAEGENVWLTEYFRFYLNGCSHQEAVSRTIAEIRSGSTSPVCGGETLIFPPRNLPNEFQASLESTYHEILGRSQSASYVDSEGANVWLAEYLRYRVAGSCNHEEAESKVFDQIKGNGIAPDCRPGTNFAGRWRGDVRITACTQTGDFATIGWCSELPVGVTDYLDINLTQAGNYLNGRVDIGGVLFPVSGTAQGNRLQLSGQTSVSGIYLTLENWSTSSAGRTMVGQFGWMGTYPGLSGEGHNVFALVGVSSGFASADAPQGRGRRLSDTLKSIAGSIKRH